MITGTAFWSYVLASNLSPGPNAFVSLSNAGRYGLKKGLRFNLGVAAGVFVILSLCGLLSAVIMNVFPSIRPFMVWIGAAYMLWLSVKTLMSKPTDQEIEKTAPGNLFLHGAVLQFINPNTILYGINVFAVFMPPQERAAGAMILYSAVLSIAAFLCTACWTLFGSLFQKWMRSHGRAVNVLLAVLLAYSAAALVIGAVWP